MTTPATEVRRWLGPGRYGGDDLHPGDGVDCGAVIVTPQMIDSFAALTGDRFEIHMSRPAAQAHGFADRVAHGLLVLSLIDGLKNQAPAQMAARASMGWDWQFRGPVLAGDRIAVVYRITGISPARQDDQCVLGLDFTVSNQDNRIAQRGTNRLLAYRGA